MELIFKHKKKIRKMRLKGSGFTLIELLIAIVISGIVMGSMYTVFKSQQESYVAQDQVAEMQQNIRAAMYIMAQEIRMAGYDSTNSANSSIIAASVGRINFTLDANDDGDCNDSNENITFGFSTANDSNSDGIADSGAADLGRNTGGGFQPIAENICAIEFFYTLANGTTTLAPATPGNIRTVRITILARAGRSDRAFTNTSTYTTPGGQTWGPFNDNFRRRIMTTTVKCRNMGL